jgi:ABC-type dipeptide transport system, periplasmic component
VDEFAAGHIDRRAFLRHGAVMGISLPILNTLVGAVGADILAPSTAWAAGTPGGTVRVAMTMPTAAIDPVTIDDQSLVLPQQTGEFLAYSSPKLMLTPVLAESWGANSAGDVWSFKIRKGVKFHNGKPFTADDVVATFDRLSDPKGVSNALSVFGGGVLTKGGTKKVDDYSVEFHLDAPNGNFPYLVSSDNYNAVILPADYAGDYEKTFNGTGAFKLDKYTPKVGVSFVRNPDYWGPRRCRSVPSSASMATCRRSFWRSRAARSTSSTRCRSRAAGGPQGSPFQGHQRALELPSAGAYAHRHGALHRQARAPRDCALPGSQAAGQGPVQRPGRRRQRQPLRADLSLHGFLGAPARAEPRRGEAAAGGGGLTQWLQRQADDRTIPRDPEIRGDPPERREKDRRPHRSHHRGPAGLLRQGGLRAIGLARCDHGHHRLRPRGVPNTVLSAPLKSDGVWNSAHFKSKEYDSLVNQYVATVDLQSQRAAAGKIQRVLLDESPVIFAYFYDWLVVTTKNLSGVGAVATGQLYLQQASFA